MIPIAMPTICPIGSKGPRGRIWSFPTRLMPTTCASPRRRGSTRVTQFFTYLKDTFDTLYAEGEAGAPKMMSVGLHCRLAGRPGRAAALARFLDYVASHDKAWLTRRIDIAWHWHAHHTAG